MQSVEQALHLYHSGHKEESSKKGDLSFSDTHWGTKTMYYVESIMHLSEGSGQKRTNNQHQMTTVVGGGLPLQFWYQTSSRCIVHIFW